MLKAPAVDCGKGHLFCWLVLEAYLHLHKLTVTAIPGINLKVALRTKRATKICMGWYMTVLSCIHALNNLMCTNILVFWGTAKVYNTVLLFIDSVRCKAAIWSVVMFCSEGTEK